MDTKKGNNRGSFYNKRVIFIKQINSYLNNKYNLSSNCLVICYLTQLFINKSSQIIINKKPQVSEDVLDD